MSDIVSARSPSPVRATAPATPSAFQALGSALATSPGRMAFCLAVIALLAAATTGALLEAVGQVRAAVQTAGVEAGPSAIRALRIGAALAELDGVVIGVFLTDREVPQPGAARVADAVGTVDRLLVEASRGVGGDAAESVTLVNLLDGLGQYQELLGAAAQESQPHATSRLEQASHLMRDQLQRQAAAMQQASLEPLDRAFAAFLELTLPRRLLALRLGLALIAALVATQMFLADLTHRTINPPLLIATLLSSVALLWLVSAMLTARVDLEAARHGAFDNLRGIYESRATGATLQADVALQLVGGRMRTAVAGDPEADIRRLLDLAHGPGRVPPGAAGEALAHAIAAQRAIVAADQAGGHEATSRHVPRTGPDDGIGAMRAFDETLQQAIAANETSFAGHTGDAMRRLGRLQDGAGAAILAAVLLAAFGLWQRWREYR